MTEAERIAAITDLQTQFKELNNEAYEKNDDLAQDRGRKFEKLVCAVFRAWGMLRYDSYYTGDNKSEQIDGVLEFDGRYALLEAKWVKANLVASELFSFLGKVEGKFAGTIGIFVSRNELTPNFLNALRAGRRQCILVIHGRDVDHLFDPSFDFAGYLSYHLLSICMDNIGHLSADKYLTKLKNIEAKKKGDAPAAAGDPVEAKIKECLKDVAAQNLVNEFAEELTPAQRVDAVQRILNSYADIASSKGGDDAWRSKNVLEFLKELVKQLPAAQTAADTTFFKDKLSRDFQSPHFGPMTEYFAPRYAYLPALERKRFEERLVQQWDKVIGEWMSENRMAVPTRFLWNQLDADIKAHLIGHFVGFVLSNRDTLHPQHQLADFVLEKEDSRPAATQALRRHAERAAKSWIEEGFTDEKGLATTTKSVTAALRDMKQYISDFEEQIKAVVKKVAEEHPQM